MATRKERGMNCLHWDLRLYRYVSAITWIFFCTFSRHFPTGRIAQSVTCLATDASLPANLGVANSIPARSHTLFEIDHEIISTIILLHSTESFEKGCCHLQAKVTDVKNIDWVVKNQIKQIGYNLNIFLHLFKVFSRVCTGLKSTLMKGFLLKSPWKLKLTLKSAWDLEKY